MAFSFVLDITGIEAAVAAQSGNSSLLGISGLDRENESQPDKVAHQGIEALLSGNDHVYAAQQLKLSHKGARDE